MAELELEDRDVEQMRQNLVQFLKDQTGRRPRTKTIHSAALELLLDPPVPPVLVYKRVPAVPVRGSSRRLG